MPSTPRNHARRNLTTTISNYSASCSSARARRIKKKVGPTRRNSKLDLDSCESPRSDWSRASIWGPGGRNGRGPVATAGAPGRWITRGATNVARAVGLRGARPRLTRPRERRGPANRTRGVERVARVGPGIGSTRSARSSNFFVEARAARARGAMATPRPPARARTMDRTRPRPA